MGEGVRPLDDDIERRVILRYIRPMPSTTSRRELVAVGGGAIEIFSAGAIDAGAPVVAAAHPASAFGQDTAHLLAETAGICAVCINPRGLGGSSPAPATYGLADMVDDLDAVRVQLGVRRWTFWGMSGGGWIGLQYAHRHPASLDGLVVESACACFRERLADPECVLSPVFPAWQPALAAVGRAAATADEGPASSADVEWIEIESIGAVMCRRSGGALLVSPGALPPEMARALPNLWAFDARPWLPTLAVRTLVVAGTADPIVPLRHVRALHQAIAGSRFVAVQGGGHVPTTERHPQIADAMRRLVTRA